MRRHPIVILHFLIVILLPLLFLLLAWVSVAAHRTIFKKFGTLIMEGLRSILRGANLGQVLSAPPA